MAENDRVRRRRVGGWGFEGETFPPTPQLLAWLEAHIGPPLHPVAATPADPPAFAPRPVADLGLDVSLDPHDRLAHARGQGLVDVLRIRTGRLPSLPDAVVRPCDSEEVGSLLRRCSEMDVRVIPWGGGTSVTGGVNVLSSDRPVVVADLERLTGLWNLDPISRLAVFGPGTPGPAVESALSEHGLTLGHYPQSWELATVGGWVATRSSGQESMGYGRIEDMVAGLELIAPDDRLALRARPASAAGPDLRQLVMGSEGRFGIITEVTLRVRPRPQLLTVESALLPDLHRGLDAVRSLVQNGVPLTVLRLSDARETEVALSIGLAASRFAPLLRSALRLRGLGDEACLALVGVAGSPPATGDTMDRVRAVIRRHRGVMLGRGPGEHWKRDRFRHPYLREGLLDLGYATDTLETATTWSQAASVRTALREAISRALESDDERVAVLCHVSHPYRDGTSLYFTFFFRCCDDPDATISRWAQIKRAANQALIETGATLSHHHGIGQWHAPGYPLEVGATGRDLVAACAHRLDPRGILAPWALLDPTDHLEA